MADIKISGLPASTTPLAGTEVLPIVQAGTTKQVSVANLTAGRSVSAADAKLTTGNLTIDTTGKGVTTTGAIPLGLGTNGSTTQAVLSTAGELLLGTASQLNDGKLCIVTGAAALNTKPSSDITYLPGRFLNSAGSTVGYIQSTNSLTAFVTTSDYRLKNSVMPMVNALEKVAALKPVTYKWNVDGSSGEGFIAHELAEVCPSAVAGQKDAVDVDGNPVYQGIDTSFLIGILTAAIQEQQSLINKLSNRVAGLENK